MEFMKKYTPLNIYNFYKRDYAKYLLLVKKKDKLITYNTDAKIVSYLFKIHYFEELSLDQNLLTELLELKEIHHFNIAVVVSSKIREYYCYKNSDYLKLKNNSKRYVKELEVISNG